MPSAHAARTSAPEPPPGRRAATSRCCPASPGPITDPSYHPRPYPNTSRSRPGPPAITFAGLGLTDFGGTGLWVWALTLFT
jgi:hypothetical protein